MKEGKAVYINSDTQIVAGRDEEGKGEALFWKSKTVPWFWKILSKIFHSKFSFKSI